MAAKTPAKPAKAKAAPAKKAATKKPATKKPAAKAKTPAPAAEPVVELSPEDQLIASLDPRHVAFVEQYLITMNGTKAYKLAFEAPDMTDHVAGAAASRLLGKVSVARLLSLRVKAMFERTEGLQDRILQTLFNVAYLDRNELMEMRRESCRYCHGDNHEYQRTPSEMDRHQAEWEKEYKAAQAAGEEPPAFDPQGGIGFDPRKEPHPDCPECFGDGREREVFKDSRTLSPAARISYLGIERTKDGLKMQTRDPEKALDTLMKYLKMYDDKTEVILGVVPQEKLDAMYAQAMESAERGREDAKRRRLEREKAQEGGK